MKEFNLSEDARRSCLISGAQKDLKEQLRVFLDMTYSRLFRYSMFGNLLRKMEDGDGLGLGIDLLEMRPVIFHGNKLLTSPFFSCQ